MFEIENSAVAILKENKLDKKPKKLEEIKKFFEVLDKSIKSGDIDATIIGKYIYDNITNEKLRYRKVSAINFEEFLTAVFEGHIVDKKTRTPEAVSLDFGSEEINRRVARNKLEKLDVVLGSLNFSVKTLVPENEELNIGSFSAEALFKGFLPYTPNEREELGSKPLLKGKFKKFEEQGKWNDFVKRFSKMVETVFQTDWIIAIKNEKVLDVYILSAKDFRELLIKSFATPESAVKTLNRFEAHALRVEVRPLIEKSHKIKINLFGKHTQMLTKIDKAISEIRILILKGASGEIKKRDTLKEVCKTIEKLLKSS
jgi:hypothetical protein